MPVGTETAAGSPGEPDAGDAAWPETDLHARLGITDREQRPPEPVSPDSPSAEEPPMVDQQFAPPPSAPPSKKPSKLMADLSAAIRSTAETARDQSLALTDAEARQVVEAIREQSTEGAAALRQRSEEDIAGIRDWSKAEIARIREETDDRISTRKSTLEQELADHAASVDHKVEEVEAEVARYQADMESYLERLRTEDDPARLATLAESMPDAPSFEAWVARPAVADEAVAAEAPEAEAEVAEPDETPTEAVAGDIDADEATAEGDAAAVEGVAEAGDAVGEAMAGEVAPAEDAVPAEADAETVDAETVDDRAPETGELETDEAPGTEASAEAADGLSADTAEAAGTADAAGAGQDTEAEPVEDPIADTQQGSIGTAWGDTAGDWTTRSEPEPKGEGDDIPRWATGETPEGFPVSDGSGDPVDRGAIMAALEAAAEAVVAAESAADSADQAEVAAGVAETAAELVRRLEREAEAGDEEARAALAARVGAGGYDTESFTDRLASLLPGHGMGGGDGEPQTSQVIVGGLVSVASIASFKRHLGRVAGVSNVAVASGPDGEFVFNVTHLPDVAFRDVIPTMPGFAARVTSAADGVVHVTARDPEAES